VPVAREPGGVETQDRSSNVGTSGSEFNRLGLATANHIVGYPIMSYESGEDAWRAPIRDATEPAAVELLFQNVVRDLGAPTIDGVDWRAPERQWRPAMAG